ncbi:sensor histidine kinase [Microbacterium pseudoresistens]|uniref:Signal transduction histidine kinase n=1 Tax=Microbacterium pseudoresistens TaxID=640634 RepID=A0A7Y9JN15_9MICO|nr:sensor histidine kinase [Microbacterium pseudoresistens]NYD54083.1 signal transduction histidine kinase [Microbacterium pseudoresistens]
MSLVNSPLTGPDPGPPRADGGAHLRASATVRAMEVGQHAIALLLTAIGVIRAIGDGTAIPTAVITGLAILAWHTAGTILPSKTRSRRLVVGWLLGFAVVWIAAVAVSPEFIWLAFLLWLLAGHLLPLRWGLPFSALVLVVVIAAPILHHGTTSYANVFGPLIGGVFAFGISRGYLQLLRDAAERERLVASLTRAQQETAELQDELALAQRQSGAIAERTRISRDIHDTIAQALSSIRLLAHAGGRTDDPAAARTLTQVETLAGDSLADVRRIVAALAPAELEDDALAAALRRMLDRAHDEVGLQAELHVDDTLPLLPTEVEVALLRTAQSALANVRLHAQATRVVMSLIDADQSVRLDITDDGRGFDVAAWEGADDAASSSYGLRFMRSRLRELGGGLDIESAPREGTAISVHLPLHADPTATNAATNPAASAAGNPTITAKEDER